MKQMVGVLGRRVNGAQRFLMVPVAMSLATLPSWAANVVTNPDLSDVETQVGESFNLGLKIGVGVLIALFVVKLLFRGIRVR